MVDILPVTPVLSEVGESQDVFGVNDCGLLLLRRHTEWNAVC